jgi:hypothetical protein
VEDPLNDDKTNDNKFKVIELESIDTYHSRNCKICRHPERAAIEYDFLHWRNAGKIAEEYSLPWRSVYRHAHAAHLFDKRSRNLRSSLEFLIEGASRVEPSADGVIRAVELYARLDDEGRLRDVPKTQRIVISREALVDANSLKIVQGTELEASFPASNVQLLRVEPVEAQLNNVPAQLDNQLQTESDLSN